MKTILLLAGAGALAVAGPAAARPKHGHDHGNGHAQHHANRPRGHAENRGRHSEHHAFRREVHRDVRHEVRRDDGRRWHDNDRNHGRHHHARFARGQRYRPGYAVYYSYGRIPWRYRHEYRLSDRYRYYYNDGYIYVVDPRTMLIEQVIAGLL